MPSSTMSDVRRDFTERIQEIENHFAFVTNLDDGTLQLTPASGSGGVSLDTASWLKTLKAGCFLIMYNLVESTMRNAIQAIFDDLESNAVDFDTCRDEIRKIVLVNLRKAALNELMPNLSRMSIDIVAKTFNKKEIFSGNVDDEHIRKVAREYGFDKPRGNGSPLVAIRDNRNDLAHGNKSFDEVGKVYGMVQINQMHQHVKRYMVSLLNNVEDYIVTKKYLAVAPATTTTVQAA